MRVGTLLGALELLREFDVDPADLLRPFDLDLRYFANPDNTIAFATMGRFVQECVRVTGCAHFGLLVGERESGANLGAVGFLVQSAPDLRTALNDLAKYHWTHAPSADVDVLVSSGLATLSYTITEPDVAGYAHILDGSMAIIFNLMHQFCGPKWNAVEVQFAHLEPEDTAPFRKFFRAPMGFNTEHTAVVFAADWLDQPLPTADPLLRLMMQQRIQDLQSTSPADTAGRVRRLLPALIGNHSDALPIVAQRLGTSVRTLMRRLDGESVTFSQLRDEARYLIARQLLINTQLPVNRIADHLGYANPSAFTRAYQRWSGCTPAHDRHARTQAIQDAHA